MGYSSGVNSTSLNVAFHWNRLSYAAWAEAKHFDTFHTAAYWRVFHHQPPVFWATFMILVFLAEPHLYPKKTALC